MKKKWKLIVLRLLRMGRKLELFHIFYWQMKYRLVFALAAVWVFQSPCKGLLPMSSSELMVSEPASFPNIVEEILLPLYLWFLCCDGKSCCVPRMCHTEMFTCVHQLFREALGDGDLGSKWEDHQRVSVLNRWLITSRNVQLSELLLLLHLICIIEFLWLL